jgi:PPM family protein phosphatase
MLYLEHFGVTDAGRVRQNNEDALLVGAGRDETLFAVADGIGGFEAGEVASSITIEVLKGMEPGEPFEAAIREANRRILAAAKNDEKLSGMGTTVVAVRFSGTQEEPAAEIAHVGDSRAYLLRGGELRPITEDHSLVAELVRSGDLTRAQAAEHPQKNLITRALGAEEDVEVDTAILPVQAGDRYVLCSDGLSDMVPEDRLSAILKESPEDPEAPATRLLSAALEAGGTDNITVVIVDVKDQKPGGEDPSGGTREMEVVVLPRNPEPPPAPSGSERRSRRVSGRRPSSGKRKGRLGRALGRLVRALALVLVVVAALTPAYMWGRSQYFLGLDEGQVVIYRGLPPNYTLGLDLNEEYRRTDLRYSEIEGPYRDRITSHELKSREEAENIVRDLRG